MSNILAMSAREKKKECRGEKIKEIEIENISNLAKDSIFCQNQIEEAQEISTKIAPR